MFKNYQFRMSAILVMLLAVFAACNQSARTENSGDTETVLTAPPDWARNSVIYEVNLRQYSDEGSIQAFIKEMPRLKELGVDILWLMPVHPIGEKNRKGTLGSYYSVRDYLDVNPEFGTKEDFKQLVDEAHKLGMYVIIDWVANHTAWDNKMIEDHPEWYTKDSLGDMIAPFGWSDVAELDYDQQALRDYMIQALMYWVDDMNIDGFRCDVAGMVPTDFWEAARDSLESIKPVFMLAEAEQADLVEKAFDADYAWNLMHIMNQNAAGEQNLDSIRNYFEKQKNLGEKRAFKMNFTTNHDENSWNGTVFERYGDAYETYGALTFIAPGMPLIYSGQEVGNAKRLEFFEKDPIEWNDHEITSVYKKLAQIKKENPALANGAYGGTMEFVPVNQPDEVLAFERTKDGNSILAFFNFSNQDVSFMIKDKAFNAAYENLMDGNGINIDAATAIDLPPYGYLILRKK